MVCYHGWYSNRAIAKEAGIGKGSVYLSAIGVGPQANTLRRQVDLIASVAWRGDHELSLKGRPTA